MTGYVSFSGTKAGVTSEILLSVPVLLVPPWVRDPALTGGNDSK